MKGKTGGAKIITPRGFIESAPQRDEGANHGPKVGTGLALLLQDFAVTASLALQHGASPVDLAKSLARVPALGEHRIPRSRWGA